MNLRLVARLLGIVSLLIGGFMIFSLPWAHPALGMRTTSRIPQQPLFESVGFKALLLSILVCLAVGGVLSFLGRHEPLRLFRKEAMAVVGLSWVMATVLGAFPFYFAGCSRGPAVRLDSSSRTATVYTDRWLHIRPWHRTQLNAEEMAAVQPLLDAGYRGIAVETLEREHPGALKTLRSMIHRDPIWSSGIEVAVPSPTDDTQVVARVRFIKMSFIDTMFESQSGFSTTGATVISELEDPLVIPHCILFWRSSSHFLGGLGIIVLFVVILGQGSAGKALMRAELPGPTADSSLARIQHAAWLFALIYCVLNLLLTVILKLFGLTWFDALCHAFGTMATGGFSTYNASLGHFGNAGIEYVVIIFMILAGTNFTLLYVVLRGGIDNLFQDVEWRTYMGIIIVGTALIMWRGLAAGDFVDWLSSLRYGLFQVVSIVTTTGYGTNNFDVWNNLARGLLLVLMFVGGCSGSTGGGMKIIRHILFVKILRLELELSYHPNVVRPIRIAGEPVEDPGLRKNILVYFGLVIAIFCGSWLFVLMVEPDATWGATAENKLIDSASAVAATLNNIGPGLGTVGPTQNYGHFGPMSKLLFTWLMMLGRVEIFVILCLLAPRFWRSA
jgi:trk system potassium uptake protein TrkH